MSAAEERPLRMLGRDTAVYAAGNAARRAVGILLIPVYTRWLEPEEYGALELLLVVGMLLFTLAGQGMGTAFFRWWPRARNDAERTSLWSSSFLHLAASGAAVCGAFALLAPPLVSRLLDGAPARELVLLLAVSTFLQVVSLVPTQLLVAERRPARFVALSLLGLTAQLGLNVWFVVGLGLGVAGVLLGHAAGHLLVVLAGVALSLRYAAPRVSRRLLREMLAFGLPLVPAGLSLWVLLVSDRLLLSWLAGERELGLYGLGNKVSDLLRLLVVTPFSTAWGAYCFQLAEREDGKRLLARAATYAFLATGVAAALLALAARPAIRVIAGEPFHEAWRVVAPLLAAVVLYGAIQVLDAGIQIARRTRLLAWTAGAGAAANVLLNLVLIPRFGMMGAAWASIASYALVAAATYAVSQRLYPIPFEGRRVGGLALLVAATIALAGAAPFDGFWADVGYRAILAALLFGALAATRLVSPRELGAIRSVLDPRA